MNRRKRRAAMSLVELLVVMGIIGVLVATILPALGRVRGAADRAECLSNLRQIGVALHQYHDAHGRLPPGLVPYRGPDRFRVQGWHAKLLPFVEQEALWSATVAAYGNSANPFHDPPHSGLGTVVRVFTCPADTRCSVAQEATGRSVALTSYLGVNGTNAPRQDGVLYRDSRIRFGDVSDGLSATLAAGERPPPYDFRFGWWYAGIGIDWRGTCDMLLGVNEVNPYGLRFVGCQGTPFELGPGTADDYCDMFHFWSMHYGGCPFLLCDGSTRALSYSSKFILPALATRDGSEPVQVPE